MGCRDVRTCLCVDSSAQGQGCCLRNRPPKQVADLSGSSGRWWYMSMATGLIFLGKLPLWAYYYHVFDFAKKTMSERDVNYLLNAQVSYISEAHDFDDVCTMLGELRACEWRLNRHIYLRHTYLYSVDIWTQNAAWSCMNTLHNPVFQGRIFWTIDPVLQQATNCTSRKILIRIWITISAGDCMLASERLILDELSAYPQASLCGLLSLFLLLACNGNIRLLLLGWLDIPL